MEGRNWRKSHQKILSDLKQFFCHSFLLATFPKSELNYEAQQKCCQLSDDIVVQFPGDVTDMLAHHLHHLHHQLAHCH